MADRPGALAGIGSTPIVRLSSFPGPGAAEVWVKLEAANPTGSYKDRMALAMIEAAEERGDLKPGQTVVEYTGGSTGSSLAFVCAIKGYPTRIVSSNAFADEKLLTMRALGADLELIHSDHGIHPELTPQMIARAAEIVEEVDGYATDQFNNLDTLNGYREIGVFRACTPASSPLAASSCQLGEDVRDLRDSGMVHTAQLKARGLHPTV